ncbi:MAG: hypothetical protein V7785_09345 [Bermanella sp.]
MAKTLYYRVGNLDNGKVVWTPDNSRSYDTGRSPSCSLNDEGVIAEVHQTHRDDSDKMYYHLGKLDGDQIAWAKTGGTNYDKGKCPSVSLNNSNVLVEVHQSPKSSYLDGGYSNAKSYRLFSRVGIIVNNAIEWNPDKATQFKDKSERPSISINNNNDLIIVEQKTRKYGSRNNTYWGHDGLKSQQGKVEDCKLFQQSTSVTFSSATDNTWPEVAVNDHGEVLAVFSKAGSDKLYYRTGKTSSNKLRINWNKEVINYTKGSHPSVSINNNGEVVEVHQASSGSKLWCKVGVLVDGKVTWDEGGSVNYTTGKSPSVSINNKNQVIEVHEQA